MPGPTPPRSRVLSTPFSPAAAGPALLDGDGRSQSPGTWGRGTGGMSRLPGCGRSVQGAQRRLLNSPHHPASRDSSRPPPRSWRKATVALPKLGKGDEGRAGALWHPSPGALRLPGEGASILRPIGVHALPSRRGSRKALSTLPGTSPRPALPGLQAQAWPSSSPPGHS